MFGLLRRRNFALLWTGGLISLLGDRMLLAALPYFVYQQSGSTIATALMVAAGLLPRLLLGSPAGVFVDRADRKKVMALTSLGQALVILPLMLIPGTGMLWIVLPVAFTQTALVVFFAPAENALLPQVVEEKELLEANSLNALNNNLARLIGPPVGGLVLAVLGLPGIVVADSLTFIAAAGLIAMVRVGNKGKQQGATGQEPAQAAPVAAAEALPPAGMGQRAGMAWRRFRAEWADGMQIVHKSRVVRVLFISVVLLNLAGVMIDPLSAAFIQDVVQAGPTIYGLLMTVQAVGGIAGGLLGARAVRRMSEAQVYGWGMVLLGGLQLLRYNVPELAVVFATSLTIGLTAVIASAAMQTLFQQRVPNEYMGRVSGALEAVMAAVSLLGVLGLSGLLAAAIGVVPVLNISAAINVLVGVMVLVWLALPERREVRVEVEDV